MNAYNINYGKVAVLFFLCCSFYWLMLPGKHEDVVASKLHPHHDSHEIEKEEQVKKFVYTDIFYESILY